jgi:uncharacterized protein YigA (DUF484 family)
VSNPTGVQGITETDIANYLANTPGFFERHADLLSSIQLTNPHGPRAVSLQERQMDLLRERLKGFEHKIMEMIRHGQENAAIADRLHRYTRSLLTTTDAAALPDVLVRELMHQFLIPQAGIRVWGAAAEHAALPFAREVSADACSFASSLSLPYCGANAGFEAATWLDDPSTIASLALIPLRHGSSTDAFGLLVLGSPDPTRFAADMGTDFLMRIGEISSAGLSRLTRAA